ncbi:MAG: GNAT family N-acetyltransferase [Nocardioidaceae bacterium]
MPEQLQVRSADDDDMLAVAAIFARYVSDTVLTFELEPPTAAAWRGRLASLAAAGWPFLVLVVDGQLVGLRPK